MLLYFQAIAYLSCSTFCLKYMLSFISSRTLRNLLVYTKLWMLFDITSHLICFAFVDISSYHSSNVHGFRVVGPYTCFTLLQ